MHSYIAYAIGLFYSLVFGHVGTWLVVKKLWKPFQKSGQSLRPHPYTPIIVGLIERTLFFFSILLGYEEFVAIWLALKVAGQWKRWEDGFNIDTDDLEMKNSGRVLYNIFLIGSGLSLGFAVMWAKLKVYMEKGLIWQAIAFPLSLFIGCLVLFGIIHILQSKHKKRKENEIPQEKNQKI